jgi:hypothetical protein
MVCGNSKVDFFGEKFVSLERTKQAVAPLDAAVSVF